jgi:flavin-binding protein dodecin
MPSEEYQGVIGTSPTSWEEAAADAISTAAGSLRDLRVAEVTKQDVVVGDAGELVYRSRSSSPSRTKRPSRSAERSRCSRHPEYVVSMPNLSVDLSQFVDLST